MRRDNQARWAELAADLCAMVSAQIETAWVLDVMRARIHPVDAMAADIGCRELGAMSMARGAFAIARDKQFSHASMAIYYAEAEAYLRCWPSAPRETPFALTITGRR